MNIQRIGVIGAGTMGSGIAQACALSGRAGFYDYASGKRVG